MAAGLPWKADRKWPTRQPAPHNSCRSITGRPAENWLVPDTKFRKGTFCYAARRKSIRSYSAQPPTVAALPSRLEAASQLEADRHPRRDEGCARFSSFACSWTSSVGCVARRQVPLLHWFRVIPETYRGLRGRADPLRLPPVLYPGGTPVRGVGGSARLTEDVLKEWFYYFYQCTECRRCSFCPFSHRHGGSDHDRQGIAQPGRLRH